MRLIDADKFWEQFEKGKANLARIKTMLPSEVVDITIAIYDEIKERLEHAPTIEPEQRWTPCDWCKYNPPSSMDGKPCTVCPAVPQQGEGNSE